MDLEQAVEGRERAVLRSHLMPSTSRPADLSWKKRTRKGHVFDSTKTDLYLFLLGLSSTCASNPYISTRPRPF